MAPGADVLTVSAVDDGADDGGTTERVVTDLARLVRAAQEGVSSPLSVLVVFRIPGRGMSPDFAGVRSAQFDAAQNTLTIEAAVPQHSPDPTTEMWRLLRDGVEEAERWARGRGVAEELPVLQGVVARTASVVTPLPTSLVARYRAVDREVVGVPPPLVDTPTHLANLTRDIGDRGIAVPLRLGFNHEFAILDGNHRIAVALRLGLDEVPVALLREPTTPRPSHARTMQPSDLAIIERAVARSSQSD